MSALTLSIISLNPRNLDFSSVCSDFGKSIYIKQGPCFSFSVYNSRTAGPILTIFGILEAEKGGGCSKRILVRVDGQLASPEDCL